MKHKARAHVSDDLDLGEPSGNSAPTVSLSSDNMNISPVPGTSQEVDEMTRFRKLVQPPSIPGVYDWGIPPATDEPPDPAIAVSLLCSHVAKSDLLNGVWWIDEVSAVSYSEA